MPRDRKFLALYAAHRNALLNYASTITGDRVNAEDVVQEAWVRCAAAVAPRENPLSYLYRVVRNLAIDGRRKADLERRRYDAGVHPQTPTPHRDTLRENRALLPHPPMFVYPLLRKIIPLAPDRTCILAFLE